MLEFNKLNPPFLPKRNFDNSVLILVEVKIDDITITTDDMPKIIKEAGLSYKNCLAFSGPNDMSLFTAPYELRDRNERLDHINRALYGNMNTANDGYELEKTLSQPMKLFRVSVNFEIETDGYTEAIIRTDSRVDAKALFMSTVNTDIDNPDNLEIITLGIARESPFVTEVVSKYKV